MSETTESARLPRSFHKTFKPERQYIGALLKYASSGRQGDIQEIGAATGIPTGLSTGKVPTTLDYCRGMGLISLSDSDRSAIKKPELTPFGRVVLIEDPYLKTSVTQWLAHLNLCSPLTGAEVWYQTFFAGLPSLGMSFERAQLELFLGSVCGSTTGSLVGPLIGMYEDEASFRACGVLSESTGRVQRRSAPISDEFGFGYGAWILQQITQHFAGKNQIPVTELDRKTGCRSIPGWDIASHQRILGLVERKGLIEVDRHMEPWLIRPNAHAVSVWKYIYDDLL